MHMNETLPSPTAHLARAVIDCADTRPVTAREAIYNTQGMKVLDKGAAIHAGLYDRLMAHQLSRPLEDSLAIEGMVDGRAIRQGIEMLLAFEAFYARLVPESTKLDRLLDIIESIPLPQAIALQLTIAREARPALYEHALRSAWLMAWMADAPLRPKFDIAMAAAAGLLHDLGMLHLNPVLTQPKIELTREQRRELYSHPIVSRLLVERHHVYPQEVVRAVMEHHEYLNGSGYPRGLRGRQISLMGQQLALADLVVAMISGHDDGGELRLSVLLRMNMHRYARPLIQRVLAVLQDAHRVLQQWPRGGPSFTDLTPARQEGLVAVSGLIDELLRTLAEAGATPEQLAHLDAVDADPLLHKELSLLAREAVWQLRAISRQARRRWAAGRQGQYPDALQTWLDQVEALHQRVHGRLASSTPADPVPAHH